MEKVLGIIGSTNPLEAISLYKGIIQNTHVNKNQDHIHVLVDSNTKMPDITEYIYGIGISPLEYLYQSAIGLINNGASILVLASITSHLFYDDLRERITSQYPNVILLNAVEQVSSYIAKSGYTSTYLLASKPIYLKKIFKKEFNIYDIDLVLPRLCYRDVITTNIHNFETTRRPFTKHDLESLRRDAKKKNAECIVLGSMKLSLMFENILCNKDSDILVTTDITAKSIISYIKTNKDLTLNII